MVSQTTVPTVDDVVAGLERDGYAIVAHLLSPQEAAEKRADLIRVLAATPTGRNDFEGFKTQRIYALFAKTRAFDGPATHPLVLGVLDRVLGPSYQLSAPVGIQIGPGETAQVLHCDHGIYPLPRGGPEIVLNTMWALDDFTEANGATRVVPGSNKWMEQRPDDIDADDLRRDARRLASCSSPAASTTAAAPTRPTSRASARSSSTSSAGCGRRRTTCSAVPREIVKHALAAAAGAARLQHLPAVHGLRGRPPPPQGAGGVARALRTAAAGSVARPATPA